MSGGDYVHCPQEEVCPLYTERLTTCLLHLKHSILYFRRKSVNVEALVVSNQLYGSPLSYDTDTDQCTTVMPVDDGVCSLLVHGDSCAHNEYVLHHDMACAAPASNHEYKTPPQEGSVKCLDTEGYVIPSKLSSQCQNTNRHMTPTLSKVCRPPVPLVDNGVSKPRYVNTVYDNQYEDLPNHHMRSDRIYSDESNDEDDPEYEELEGIHKHPTPATVLTRGMRDTSLPRPAEYDVPAPDRPSLLTQVYLVPPQVQTQKNYASDDEYTQPIDDPIYAEIQEPYTPCTSMHHNSQEQKIE